MAVGFFSQRFRVSVPGVLVDSFQLSIFYRDVAFKIGKGFMVGADGE